MNTEQQYEEVINRCKSVYVKKALDYGASWRVYRTISIIDQIYIKAWRIRQIQELGTQKIEDTIESEFMAIVNYGIIGLIQLDLGAGDDINLSQESLLAYYEKHQQSTYQLMLDKNHDYGEAWRQLSQASFVDLILSKVLRVRQILANGGKTIISEGIDANFADIINYSIFALIKLQEGK